MSRLSTVLFVIVFAVLMGAPRSAAPISGVANIGKDAFDDWNVCRTRTDGADGYLQIQPSGKEFRPALAFESLGENREKAYWLGAELAKKYSYSHHRAEKAFLYVRDHVKYMPDIDNYGKREYAVNADESALAIETRGYHKGDCEDMAFLLATMFRGAGLRSAIVWTPGHVAVMVHLPFYTKANMDWTFKNESGWVWAEPTGRTNPFGWTPSELIGSELLFYELSEEAEVLTSPPFKGSIHVERDIPPGELLWGYFFSILCFLLIVSGAHSAAKDRGWVE